MTKKQKNQIKSAIVIAIGLLLWSTMANAQSWEPYGEGIEYSLFRNNISVFKIDQDIHTFKVRGSNTNPKPLPEWVENEVGGINLNMFVAGYLPQGYTKINNRVIQPEFAAYNLFIVWNKDRLTILDRTEESMDSIMSWPNISQNIRMMKRDINGKNRWSDQPKKWSVSTIATTTDGDVLFIHSRTPFTMHQFNNLLLMELRRLKIDRMAYLEGGPESGLIIKGHNKTFSQVGSYETDFNEYYDNIAFWPIPWTLTFKKK